MPRRIESPSSLNTFLQCPRKYYYHYIEKMPTSPSIHLVRGNVAHSVLEELFDDLEELNEENFRDVLKVKVQNLLILHWKKKEDDLRVLDLGIEDLGRYFSETLMMLNNWVDKFSDKVVADDKPFLSAFQKHVPVQIEEYYKSEELSVQGYIDAIEDIDGKVRVMDYKTSREMKMTEAYRLQLGIYALLYNEKHGKYPDFAGLYFLKHDELVVGINDELLEFARQRIEFVHSRTESDNIDDYEKNVTPLCKWSTGQCDFYEQCFMQRDLRDY